MFCLFSVLQTYLLFDVNLLSCVPLMKCFAFPFKYWLTPRVQRFVFLLQVYFVFNGIISSYPGYVGGGWGLFWAGAHLQPCGRVLWSFYGHLRECLNDPIFSNLGYGLCVEHILCVITNCDQHQSAISYLFSIAFGALLWPLLLTWFNFNPSMDK